MFSALKFLLIDTLTGTKTLLKLKLQDLGQGSSTRDQDQEGCLKVGIVLSLSALELFFLWTAAGASQGQRQGAGLSQPWV